MKFVNADFVKEILLKKAEFEENKENRPPSWSFAYEAFANDLDTFPAADVEPVRHGKWIYKCQNQVGDYNYKCSVCKRWVRVPVMKDIVTMPYCHCGAKMDGKEREN